MRNVCVQRVSKRCLVAICVENTLCIRYQLATFFAIRTQIVIFIFLCVDCASLYVTGTNLGQRKHNEFRACALLVPSIRLALVLHSFGVDIHTWKNALFLRCAEII